MEVYLGIADLKFNSVEELVKNFNQLDSFLLSYSLEERQTLYLRLHWQKQTLTKEYQAVALERIRELKNHYKSLNLFSFMPQCFHDPLGLASFPDCESCVYSEAFICRWPWQSGCEYVNEPQRDFKTIDISKISDVDFLGREPLTWIRPSRKQINLCRQMIDQCDGALDFGCGNGFIDYLILEQGLRKTIYGFDPFHPPQVTHPRFQRIDHLRQFPLETSGRTFAAISALADYNVPVQEIFTMGNLPKVFLLFQFPSVFGAGGQKIEVEIIGGKIVRQVTHQIFSLQEIEKNYNLLFLEKTFSDQYTNACFRIYVRKDAMDEVSIDLAEWVEPYPWEKRVVPKKDITSSESLL